MDRMEAFRLLASADRQLVLHELVEGEGRTDVTTLSRRVAARRHRTPPERLSDTKVERAHVRLVHDHLPQLQESEVIDVRWNENELALADGAEVERLFDAAEELESWPPDDLLEPPSRRR